MTENPKAPHWKMRKEGGFIPFSWLPPVEVASARQCTTCCVFGPGWPSDHILLLNLSRNQKWLGSCLLPWAALVMYVMSLLTLTRTTVDLYALLFSRGILGRRSVWVWLLRWWILRGIFFFPPELSEVELTGRWWKVWPVALPRRYFHFSSSLTLVSGRTEAL